jgi:hypothetical protein
MIDFKSCRSATKHWRHVFVFIPALIVLFLPSFAMAGTKQVPCNTLIGKMLKAGKVPTVMIDTDFGIVRITTTDRHCLEPLEEFQRRKLLWPFKKFAQGDIPKKIKKASSSAIKSVPDAPKSPCDLTLAKYWSKGRHTINGAEYWLSEIFTIDRNKDGYTDNLGFKMIAKDHSSRIIRYFGSEEQESARQLSSMALPDDSIIERFCFGRTSFNEPPQKRVEKITGLPNLTSEINSRMESPNKTTRSAPKQPGVGTSIRLWMGIAVSITIALIAIGSAVIFGIRRRKNQNEDNDDEDEDKPPGAKPGNSIPDRSQWPKIADDTIDWETLFEDEKTGMIAVVSASENPELLKQQAQAICQTVFNRRRDKSSIKNVNAFLNRVIPEDAQEENLPAMQASVVNMLRKLKEDRLKRAAAFLKKGRKNGNRRSSAIIDFFKKNMYGQITAISIFVILLPLAIFMASLESTPEEEGPKGNVRKHIQWINEYTHKSLPWDLWELLSVKHSAVSQISIEVMLLSPQYVKEISKLDAVKRFAVLKQICPDANSDITIILDQGWSLWIIMKSPDGILHEGACKY